MFGVTRERIRQIEAKALRKLRHQVVASVLKILWTKINGESELTIDVMYKRNLRLKTILCPSLFL